MKRKPKLVHLTNHSCLANGLKPHETSYLSPSGYRKDKFEDAYGHYARHPASFGRHCRYGSWTSLLTMDLDAVTCTDCRESVVADSRDRLFENASRRGTLESDKRYYEQRAEAWCDEDELKVRAWLVCCRHVGAPCPVSRREAIKRLRAERAREVYQSVRSAVVSGSFLTAAMMTTNSLTKALEKMPPDDRKLLRGVLGHAKKADTLIAKAAKINDSIEALAVEAAKRIRSHAVIELPTEARAA